MRILFVTSEAVPYSKTGGLADVCGALPDALSRAGCEVVVVTPYYGNLLDGSVTATTSGDLVEVSLPPDGGTASFEIAEDNRGGDGARYVFLNHGGFFARPELYVDPATGKDWKDNDRRYLAFSRAALAWAHQVGFAPDILHVHDWQAAPAAVYLKTVFRDTPSLARTRSVLTIHNLAYQGLFAAKRFANWGLGDTLYYPMSPFEFYGKVNFLKAGIAYADKLTTVSARYAEEIRGDAEYGCGLEGVLSERAADLSGVVNGIDPSVWSPQHDRQIPVRYTVGEWGKKRECKQELFRRVGWAQRRIARPTVGMISRLVDQKGFDLLDQAATRLFALGVHVVLLGRGDAKYHRVAAKWTRRFPKQFFVSHEFDETLAHLIEAGSDIFLMPSRYEPCGLNQMYSMAYGTIPVVRATGGLADTVVDRDDAPDRSTGFVFSKYSAEAMLRALRRALDAYRRKSVWRALQRRGMTTDFSWDAAAGRYKKLYQDALRP